MYLVKDQKYDSDMLTEENFEGKSFKRTLENIFTKTIALCSAQAIVEKVSLETYSLITRT